MEAQEMVNTSPARGHTRSGSTAHDAFAPFGGYYRGFSSTQADRQANEDRRKTSETGRLTPDRPPPSLPPGVRAESAGAILPATVYKRPSNPSADAVAMLDSTPVKRPVSQTSGSRSPRFREHIAAMEDTSFQPRLDNAAEQRSPRTPDTDSPTLGRDSVLAGPSLSDDVRRKQHLMSWTSYDSGQAGSSGSPEEQMGATMKGRPAARSPDVSPDLSNTPRDSRFVTEQTATQSEAQWNSIPNDTLLRPSLSDNLSMTSEILQEANDVDSWRSKLSAYTADNSEDMNAVQTSQSMLIESGAFAKEKADQSELPIIVHTTAEGILRNNVSRLGSCNSTPEKIQDAVEKFEAIYIDQDCRADNEQVASDGTKSRKEDLDGAEARQRAGMLRMQELCLPEGARIQSQEAVGGAQQKPSVGRKPLQELNLNSLMFSRSPGSFQVFNEAENTDRSESVAKGRVSQPSGTTKPHRRPSHKTDVLDKENVEPSVSEIRYVHVGKNKEDGTLGASSYQKVRPPGLSQVEWLQTMYGSQL
ncbi:hypothetical protein LTR65_001292 [Meristemomyces frigidus]